ncbi:MAG: TonB-dependent receptor [Gammaproteobacteria bacterium]|nr:TonB-dependent receptor [Gammaproteobacteria bacterium]
MRYFTVILLCGFGLVIQAKERRIEEMVVTAEKREASISDTSISITAFDQSMIEELGMQNADELVNYVPATTRDDFDIRIRGVGRNFRALGGDPGVATYYNGVYSEDFGIATTENAWFDLARVEVLRGPQGTLYGRNSIGGALNFITNQPNYEWEGVLRTQFSNYDERQFYALLSGPLVKDKLAFRLVGVKLFQDGVQEGRAGTENLDTVNDENFSLALDWRISDTLNADVRWNTRSAKTIPGQRLLINSGIGALRATLDRDSPVRGYTNNYGAFTPITGTTPGAIGFTDPRDGSTRYAAPVRPGLDRNPFPHNINPTFGDTGQTFNGGGDIENIDRIDGTNNNRNDLRFDQQAINFHLTWDLNETTQLKYIGGYSEFEFITDTDNDLSNATLSNERTLGDENVHTFSNELQLLWQIGDNLSLTSGIYQFYSNRNQYFALANDSDPRITNAVDYGGFASFVDFAGPQKTFRDADVFASLLGTWDGDAEGRYFTMDNLVETTQWAVYSQGTYTFNDEYALTLGVRWAKDEKEALERRQGYFEEELGDGGFMDFVIPALDTEFGFDTDLVNLTPLGVMNIFMGNATATFDPDFPLIPTCAIEDQSCATPLRLGGVPLSFATQTLGENEWSEVTGRINLDWTPNENTLVYFSVTSGYRAGGYSLGVTDARDFPRNPDGTPINTAVIGAPFDYDEETVVAYELGYKGALLDGSLQLFATLYRYDYENYQDELNVFDPVRNRGVQVVENAPEAENFGFEVEVVWLATEDLTIGGNYSFTDTQYSADYLVVEFDDPNVPQAAFGGLSDPANASLYINNVKGNALKRIPEHKGTLWGMYQWQLEWGTINFVTSVQYTGEYLASGLDRTFDEVPKRTRVDMSIRWSSADERWSVRAYMDNVFDEIDVRNIDAADSDENWALTGSYLEPRRFGIDIRRNFGS